jgi:hypothetical protein
MDLWIAGKGWIAELDGFGGRTQQERKNSRKNRERFRRSSVIFFIDGWFHVSSTSREH